MKGHHWTCGLDNITIYSIEKIEHPWPQKKCFRSIIRTWTCDEWIGLRLDSNGLQFIQFILSTTRVWLRDAFDGLDSMMFRRSLLHNQHVFPQWPELNSCSASAIFCKLFPFFRYAFFGIPARYSRDTEDLDCDAEKHRVGGAQRHIVSWT
jgi:hypothetical protein